MKKENRVVFWLAARNIMKNKRKYIAALLAVFLTALLFSAVASLGYMLYGSIREAGLRDRGDKSMAALRFILPSDYEELKDDSLLKSASYSEIVSMIETETHVIEVRYGEDEFAENMYGYPSVGKMPEGKLEFAASLQALEAMGVEANIGEKTSLAFALGDGVYTDTFTLCGYWDAVNANGNQLCWVSKAFCDEMVDVPTVAYLQQDVIDFAGYYIMDMYFHDSRNIERDIIDLLQKHGYDPDRMFVQINSVSNTQTGTEVIVAVIVGIGFLMLVGYLLIYNIFHIRIALDTQYYALLSAVGMDERQLGMTVRAETVFLTIVGAPLGILAGRILAYFLLPFAAQFLSFGAVGNDGQGVAWWVYLLIFLFTGITVYLSGRKPAKIARQVALVSGMNYQGKVRRRRQSGEPRLSVRQLAVWNILREKGKLWTVVAAVSFAVILFDAVYSMVGGFNMEKYLADRIDSDYLITDTAILHMGMEQVLDGISPELGSRIEQLEGLGDFRYTYMAEEEIIPDTAAMTHMEQMYSDSGMPFHLTENGGIGCQIYGMDERDAAEIDFIDGAWDAEKFASGRYAIVNTPLNIEDFFYLPGDEVTVRYPDGGEVAYEVLAIGEVPYLTSARYWTDLGCRVILPESEYKAHVQNAGAMVLRCNRQGEGGSAAENELREIVSEAGLACMSREDYAEEFASFKNAYLLIGGMLAAVIGLIGLLNFANTIITSVNYRERELTILNVIGMTEGQCSRMLLWEGFFYAALSILFTDTVGVVISYGLVKFAGSLYDFVDWNFNMIPLLVGNLLFLLIAFASTLLAYWALGKKELGLRLQKFN